MKERRTFAQPIGAMAQFNHHAREAAEKIIAEILEGKISPIEVYLWPEGVMSDTSTTKRVYAYMSQLADQARAGVDSGEPCRSGSCSRRA